MIVAHPDDESIFGGACLLKEKGWKVICVTNGDNKVRAGEFKKAMKFIEADYEIWDFKDIWKGDFDRKTLSQRIKRILDETDYKMVVTHNVSGEYGHSQHKALYEVISSHVKRDLYTFEKTDTILDLDLLRKKLRLLTFYKSQKLDRFKKYIVYEGLKRIH